MSRQWSILYRGPLSSCNYACGYCPFAKTVNTREELHDDAVKLARFVDWVLDREETIAVLFTPWGEALFHAAYQEAITVLSRAPNVRCVAIQTNLSARLDWLAACDKRRVALWATYHPTQTTREKFLAQCATLDTLGVPYSAGVVGLKEHFAEIEALRAALDPRTYLWVNAYKRQPGYYSESDVARLTSVDPLFELNNRYHPSLGKPCHAGSIAFTVDGGGVMRRCHFVQQPIGNIYEKGFDQALRERPCPNESCGCHIGYVHLKELDLYSVFGDGILSRIPSTGPSRHFRNDF